MENVIWDNIDLTTPYKPVAIYYEEGDYVEYVRKDDPIVYRRVDEFLTLALDMFSRDMVGFRLKGFKNFYVKELSKKYDCDFIPLVSILERIVGEVGEEAVKDDTATSEAYAKAQRLAEEDKVELPGSLIAA